MRSTKKISIFEDFIRSTEKSQFLKIS